MNIFVRMSMCVLVFVLSVSYAHAQDAPAGSDTGKAGNIAVELNLGGGIMRGHTQYQIGGDVEYPDGTQGNLHFPISELKFPLDVYMASVDASVELYEKWGLLLSVKKNVTDKAGKLEDSDWGFWHNGAELPHAPGFACNPDYCTSDSLDIYSESDAELDAIIIDLDLRYRFSTKEIEDINMSFFVGVGGIYEKFQFEVSDLDQWYPSYAEYFGVDLGHTKVNGKVLTYDIKYLIPYIKLGTSYQAMDRLDIEASIAFSPYVVIEDEDNHILRDKVSEGYLEGIAFLVDLEGRYNFTKHWSLAIEGNFMTIDASGEQEQYINDASIGKIEEEVKSDQYTAFLKAGYAF